MAFKNLRNLFKADNVLFAETLKATKLSKNEIKFGHIKFKCENGVIGKVGYNMTDDGDMLGGVHQYTFIIGGQYVPLSLQLYSNRLFAYTKGGMTLSVNLEKDIRNYNAISLSQGVNFYERSVTADSRKKKQEELTMLLHNLGYEIENGKVLFGTFAPLKKTFLNTTTEKFLNDFLAFALLKGHFQGNKGYDLTVEPLFAKLLENTLKEIEKVDYDYDITSRSIPLKLRYAVLKRDNSTCQRCGRTPAKDGAVLHIDHKVPYSLGGLTEENNLWALCSECNLGKSNWFIDD